jgi:hypothetical protein
MTTGQLALGLSINGFLAVLVVLAFGIYSKLRTAEKYVSIEVEHGDCIDTCPAPDKMSEWRGTDQPYEVCVAKCDEMTKENLHTLVK